MATKRSLFPMTLLGTSIVLSLMSLALLFAWPRHTGEWRTSLNTLSIALVLTATTLIVRARQR
jgi:hypothetical protein